MNLQEELFTIQQVSTRLNIPKPTLRFWEKELNGILVPIRTLGKQRRYNLEHLAIIGMVRELREKGISLAEIKKQNNTASKGDNSNSNRIDLLVARGTEVVRAEVNRFLKRIKRWKSSSSSCKDRFNRRVPLKRSAPQTQCSFSGAAASY